MGSCLRKQRQSDPLDDTSSIIVVVRGDQSDMPYPYPPQGTYIQLYYIFLSSSYSPSIEGPPGYSPTLGGPPGYFYPTGGAQANLSPLIGARGYPLPQQATSSLGGAENYPHHQQYEGELSRSIWPLHTPVKKSCRRLFFSFFPIPSCM